MITAIIIDDEPHCIDKLSYLLTQHHKNTIQLLSCFTSAEEGIEAIEQLQPDLVFLDVQLGEQTGFDVLQHFDDTPFAVIFTTAHEKYAIRAIRFSAVDYLLKPIDADELKEAVDKLKKELSKENISQKLKTLLGNLEHKDAVPKRIIISTVNSDTVLPVSDIIHCESNSNYTSLFLKDGTYITASKTLKDFDELLSDYNFFRVHSSHLINLAYVKKYDKVKSVVLMTYSIPVPVSTRRKEAFLEALAKM